MIKKTKTHNQYKYIKQINLYLNKNNIDNIQKIENLSLSDWIFNYTFEHQKKLFEKTTSLSKLDSLIINFKTNITNDNIQKNNLPQIEKFWLEINNIIEQDYDNKIIILIWLKASHDQVFYLYYHQINNKDNVKKWKKTVLFEKIYQIFNIDLKNLPDLHYIFKKSKYSLTELIKFLLSIDKQKNFIYGNFENIEIIRFAIRDLKNMRQNNIIKGQFKIIQLKGNSLKEAIIINNFKIIGDLNKYLRTSYFMNAVASFRSVVINWTSSIITFIILTILSIYGITAHIFT